MFILPRALVVRQLLTYRDQSHIAYYFLRRAAVTEISPLVYEQNYLEQSFSSNVVL